MNNETKHEIKRLLLDAQRQQQQASFHLNMFQKVDETKEQLVLNNAANHFDNIIALLQQVSTLLRYPNQ